MITLSYLISPSLIHRKCFLSMFLLPGHKVFKWLLQSEGLFFLRALAFFNSEKKRNIFCQKFHTLIGKIQRYKTHPKKQRNKTVSKEAKISQLLKPKSSLSEIVPSERQHLGFIPHNVKEQVKKSFMFFLVIHWFLPVIFSIPIISKPCQRHFVNPLTEDCRSSLFPDSPLALSKELKVSVYCDQGNILTKKLGIQHVPASMTQEQLLLRIKDRRYAAQESAHRDIVFKSEDL